MKTITLTDKQFDTLFDYVDNKVTTIVNDSIDYQDSELLQDFEDLIDVHTVLEEDLILIEITKEQLELLEFIIEDFE